MAVVVLVAANGPVGASPARGADPLDAPPARAAAPLEASLVDWARGAGPGDELPVIVGFGGGSSLPRAAGSRAARRRAVIEHLRRRAEAPWRALEPVLRAGGARRVTLLWAAGAVAATVRPALLRDLARHPLVADIRVDRRWTLPAPRPAPGDSAAPPVPRPAPGDSPAWNLGAVHAPELWDRGITGAGVVVAVLDTGVDAQHPDLAGAWRGAPGGWFDPAGEHAAPADLDGHGTRVLGLLAGGAQSGAPIGVAPGARWIAARIFDDVGGTSFGAIHASLQWLLDPDGDPDTDDAPDVVNNSWGLGNAPGECVIEFDADLEALRASGIVVVFAAGNDGPAAGSSISPANSPGVMSVGAVDESLALLGSSSRGPSACGGGTYPAVVAPGDAVRTADLTYGGVVPESYATVSGTSFAAPHVAGAAALLRQACPAATAAAIEAALRASAVDLGPTGPDDGFGAGRIDAAAARQRLADDGECAATAGDGGAEDGGGLEDGGSDDDAGAAADGGPVREDAGGSAHDDGGEAADAVSAAPADAGTDTGPVTGGDGAFRATGPGLACDVQAGAATPGGLAAALALGLCALAAARRRHHARRAATTAPEEARRRGGRRSRRLDAGEGGC